MRSTVTVAALSVVLAIGCRRAPAPVPAFPAVLPAGLYTDAEIRKLAKFDIDKEGGSKYFPLDVPCLDVVPSGLCG